MTRQTRLQARLLIGVMVVSLLLALLVVFVDGHMARKSQAEADASTELAWLGQRVLALLPAVYQGQERARQSLEATLPELEKGGATLALGGVWRGRSISSPPDGQALEALQAQVDVLVKAAKPWVVARPQPVDPVEWADDLQQHDRLLKASDELATSALLARQSVVQRGNVLWVSILFVFAGMVAAMVLLRGFLLEGRQRAAAAESLRVEAEQAEREARRQGLEAKRANEMAQSAILRLMNELQEVADGDLTIHATVSEDITGAIADSINYTIDELRNLVGRINAAAALVDRATVQAQETSSHLIGASGRQSKEIRDNADQLLGLAHSIRNVAVEATASVDVAHMTLSAAESGAVAVRNAIAGMNDIREQIQDTAKRIKRLGESSQEIGEIIELISDITEQTNVLSLNAAIQAASGGEAGRGFSVVAEEVQRLAERSGEATRQIAILVRTIQADTHDAIAAMERSTLGVVEGTRLSDAAGQALNGIGDVSRRLAGRVGQIAETASREARSADEVARSIDQMLRVAQQTSAGVEQTAGAVRQIADLTQELRRSVARFRVS